MNIRSYSGSRSSIQLIQHNCNKQNAALQALFQQALEASADILLIQEPPGGTDPLGWVPIQHSSFFTIPPDPPLSFYPLRPRVLAYVRKASMLEFRPRGDLVSDLDCQIIEILGPETFYILNVYNQGNRDTPSAPNLPAPSQGPWTESRLLRNLSIPKKTLIMGDFNRNHWQWNSEASSSEITKASALVSWLDNLKTTCLVDSEEVNNKGGTLLRGNLQQESVIDLAFITPGF